MKRTSFLGLAPAEPIELVEEEVERWRNLVPPDSTDAEHARFWGAK